MTGYIRAWKGAAVLVCAALLAGSASAVLFHAVENREREKPDDTAAVKAKTLSDGESAIPAAAVWSDALRAKTGETGAAQDTAGTSGTVTSGTGTEDAPSSDSGAVQDTGEPPAAPHIKLETYAGIPCEARLGDGLTVAVDRPPKHGAASADSDCIVYVPEDGFTGVDRFTYTVTDGAGRVSKPAKVTVRVKKAAVAYEDMDGHPAAYAAQEMAEAGVFTGENIGGRYFFGPDETLTRSEFLAMAMEALGQAAPDVTITGFCDDGAIPAWAKPYVSAAVSAGILRGVSTEEGAAFLGGEPVTWQQAAAMLDRALEPGDVDLAEWFGDREEPGLWAAQAVGNLEAMGALPAGSFGSLTMEQPLTREGAARILSSARAAMKSAEADGAAGGVLGWLMKK